MKHSFSNPKVRMVPYGPNAVIIYFGEEPGVLSFNRGQVLIRSIESGVLSGVVEFTPAFTSILLEFNQKIDRELLQRVEAWLRSLDFNNNHGAPGAKQYEIPVVYTGPDLDRVASYHRISVDEVVELHSKPMYTVGMLGFSPGFPYLLGLDPRLATPRLDKPRVRVPAGSVAIGASQTGVYPTETPGGWNIIGNTSIKLFPVHSNPDLPGETMFLLRPGDQVRFRRIDASGI